MLDYVVYHKAKVMGYEVVDVDDLAIHTKKSTKGVIGSRVWLIAGKGSPRMYKLRAILIISAIERLRAILIASAPVQSVTG